ncbi:50S ribosomal protein L24 [Candidatus Woesearchaeota archaeon]|nr:50S ribosomal protein L24 [Candidatus Woesearchaeota archaeon]
MSKLKFSTAWKRSTKARKQRRYRFNAPLHLKQKQLHVHLSPDLRKKYGYRNVQARKNDKVKVLRGPFAKKEGKVERINLKKERVFITGIEMIKKDGTKLLVPLHPSNLMIIDLDLNDKKRKHKLESKKKAVESSKDDHKAKTKSNEDKK